MTKFITLLKNAKAGIVSFFTSGTTASYVAIGAVSVVSLATVSVAAVLIISSATAPSDDTTTPYSEVVADVSEAETTTELITTTEPTTVAPTTEPPTTTLPLETTTEETTTPPETLNTDDLDIRDDSESDETEPVRDEVDEEPETEPPTTAPPVETQPSTEAATEAPTEPPTEAPVSEYACVVKGIDISKWNSLKKTPIDWKKVKDSGVSFVIIRAGYRSIASTAMYEDPYFTEHIEGALAEGLQVGVYFYSQAITETEALEEASFLLSLIKDYKLTYPVCFDWEPTSGTRVREANLTKQQATNIAKKFLSTIQGYGYDAMLYSYHSAINEFFYMDQLSDYKAWVAYYFSKYKNTGVQYQIGDPLPTESYPYQMWQYTSTATCPGIQGQVDMNVAFFSYSGSGVPTSAIVLNLPATSYTTNVGTPVDYKTGVKAFNTAGLDVSSSVTTSISDGDGNLISASEVFNTPGSYTITYTIKDFTGAKKSAIAKLTVRSKPTINLTSNELTFDCKDTDYDTIANAIRDNIISAYDHEKNKLDISNITISGLDAILAPENSEETTTETDTSDNTSSETTTTGSETDSSETTSSEENSSENNSEDSSESSSEDNSSSDSESSGENNSSSENGSTTEEPTYDTHGLLTGDFIITYTVTDSKGLSNTVSVTLHIVDIRETENDETTTVEDETTTVEDETTTVNDETTTAAIDDTTTVVE